MKHATPTDLRARARHLMSESRRNWLFDPQGARDSRDEALNLLSLASEAEQAGATV